MLLRYTPGRQRKKRHVRNFLLFNICERNLNYLQKWMEAFNVVSTNVHLGENLNNGHALDMTTFDKPTSCDVCFKLLKGLFYQGYKCSKCGRAVHQDCAIHLPFCGPLSEPPEIPPRPISFQLPSVMANGDSLDESRDSADELEARSYPHLPRQGSDGSGGSLVLAPPLTTTLPAASITSNNFSRYVGNCI